MILLIEMQCKDWEHNKVNAGLIRQIKAAFPNETMIFFAEKAHLEQVNHLLAAEGIETGSCEIDFKDWRQRDQDSRSEYAGLLKTIIKNNPDTGEVILLSSNKGIILACRDVALQYDNIIFHIVLHAALEEICCCAGKGVGNIIRKLWRRIRHWRAPVKPAITMKECMEKCTSDNCRFILYSPNYREGLNGKLSKGILEKITFLHHPFSTNIDTSASRKEYPQHRSAKIKIGIYGQAVTQNAIDIVKSFNQKYDNGNVCFQAIACKGSDIWNQPNVVRLFENDYVSNEELEAAINGFDYILIPYDRNQYIVTASGIFSDAVSQEKPVLMLDSPYLKYYSQYNLGLMENSIDSMAKTISTLNADDTGKYAAGARNLKELSFEDNVSKLRGILRGC